jgi:hypothetical protein
MAIGNLDTPDDTKAKNSDFVSSRFSINSFGDHIVFLGALCGSMSSSGFHKCPSANGSDLALSARALSGC